MDMTAALGLHKLSLQATIDHHRPHMYLLSWRWHILSIQLKAGPGISSKTCGLDGVFPSDDLGFGPYTPFDIYISYTITAI